MSTIHLLDQDTINKIAAGEVVERPISVIKELIENAIDAKATAITLEIEDGGLKLIRMTDNGAGMDKDDVKQAFLRHATSKISSAKDLDSIVSLGFRGEALASIAAVSMVECMTKNKDDITGIRYSIEGGIEKAFQDIGCPKGTTLIIRELFFNVPARKKFLKSGKTEGGYVTDLIYRMALSHPGISFKYIMNGKVKLHTSGNYSLLDCIYQVFGRDFAKNSKEVKYVSGDIKITGFIGEPILSRGNRSYEIYFVNGRYIKSKWIQKGIEDGTKEAMMIHQFPFAVLFLDMPMDFVDVNVHPNKMQVRFHDEQGIVEHFRQAVLQAMHKREPVALVSLSEDEDKILEKRIQKEEHKKLKEAPEPFEVNRLSSVLPKMPKVSNPVITRIQVGKPLEDKPSEYKPSEYKPSEDKPSEEKPSEDKLSEHKPSQEKPSEDIKRTAINTQFEKVIDTQEMARETQEQHLVQPKLNQKLQEVDSDNTIQESKEVVLETEKPQQVEVENLDNFLDEQQIKKHKIIGQAFKTYWIVEYNTELYIVDQHAAHEKVLYEAWLKSIEKLSISSQILLEPLVYDLSDSEFDVFETFHDAILQLGFDVEAFGETTIIVKSVPYLLNMPLNDLDFIFFFDQLVSGEASIKKEEQYLSKIASIACKSAIKGNDKLSVIEYHHLIDQLLRLDDPYHCPHGRPTMIRMSKYELEKKFRRIV